MEKEGNKAISRNWYIHFEVCWIVNNLIVSILLRTCRLLQDWLTLDESSLRSYGVCVCVCVCVRVCLCAFLIMLNSCRS